MHAVTRNRTQCERVLSRNLDSNSKQRALAKHLLALCQVFSRSTFMMDVVMLAIGIVFFALSIGYVYACDRL
jgi:hypothetical protein